MTMTTVQQWLVERDVCKNSHPLWSSLANLPIEEVLPRVLTPLGLCWLAVVDGRGPKVGALAWLEDYQDANLRGVDLRGADLREADLRGANLYGADLRDADLRDADFCGADLRDVDFRGADLRGADFCGAFMHVPRFVNKGIE